MTYPYLGRLSPAVGKGFGGLPRRKPAVVAEQAASKKSFLLDCYTYLGVNQTTYPGCHLFSEDVALLMQDSACYLRKGTSGSLTSNASLQSFYTASTVAVSRTFYRLPDTNYVIANTASTGTWKLWLLKINDHTLALGSIVFTPVQDITSVLTTFPTSQRVSVSNCFNIAQGRFLLNGSVVSVANDVLSYHSTIADNDNLIFPVSKYPDCFIKFRTISAAVGQIGVFCVNSDATTTEFTGTFYPPTSSKLSFLSDTSFSLDDGNLYTIDFPSKSIVLSTGFSYSGKQLFCPFRTHTGIKSFSCNTAMLVVNVNGAQQIHFVINPQQDGNLLGVKVYSKTTDYYQQFGSYKSCALYFGNTASDGNQYSLYFKEQS